MDVDGGTYFSDKNDYTPITEIQDHYYAVSRLWIEEKIGEDLPDVVWEQVRESISETMDSKIAEVAKEAYRIHS